MERITDIGELKAGQKIWRINGMTGKVEIIEFVCINPHHPSYSIFLNENYDGMPKFYNRDLLDYEYFRYDASQSCWEHIYDAQQAWVKKEGELIERRREQTRGIYKRR